MGCFVFILTNLNWRWPQPSLLVSMRDVDNDEEYEDAYEQATSETQQEAVQDRPENIHGTLLVGRDWSALHNQIQVTWI